MLLRFMIHDGFAKKHFTAKERTEKQKKGCKHVVQDESTISRACKVISDVLRGYERSFETYFKGGV